MSLRFSSSRKRHSPIRRDPDDLLRSCRCVHRFTLHHDWNFRWPHWPAQEHSSVWTLFFTLSLFVSNRMSLRRASEFECQWYLRNPAVAQSEGENDFFLEAAYVRSCPASDDEHCCCRALDYGSRRSAESVRKSGHSFQPFRSTYRNHFHSIVYRLTHDCRHDSRNFHGLCWSASNGDYSQSVHGYIRTFALTPFDDTSMSMHSS